jgi:hypothetical protein
VEVTQPTASFVEKRVREVLYTLANGVRAVECQFVLHVCLLREPTKNEVSLLCARLPEFCRLPAPRQAKLIDGMGYLYLSQTDIGKLHFPEVPELVGKPKIGLAMLTAGGPQGAPHHQVSVAIPFTDERGEEILRRESKQLPPKGPGLIMININGSDGNFDAWSSLILPRFKANIHTRVSGVILFSAGWRQTVHGYEFRPETKLLSNPHAKHQLSEWIHRVVSQ